MASVLLVKSNEENSYVNAKHGTADTEHHHSLFKWNTGMEKVDYLNQVHSRYIISMHVCMHVYIYTDGQTDRQTENSDFIGSSIGRGSN